MLKTPRLGPLMAAMLLAGAAVSFAAPTSVGGAMARAPAARPAGAGSGVVINAWDGRRLDPSGITTVGEGDLGAGVTGSSWDEGAAGPDHDGADGVRPASDFTGASKLANLAPDAAAEALPLSRFAGNRARSAPAHGAAGVWDIVNRVRYGHLPEPASWALMLIGFGMIGAALRGFVVANRRLARLQPEDGE